MGGASMGMDRGMNGMSGQMGTNGMNNGMNGSSNDMGGNMSSNNGMPRNNMNSLQHMNSMNSMNNGMMGNNSNNNNNNNNSNNNNGIGNMTNPLYDAPSLSSTPVMRSRAPSNMGGNATPNGVNQVHEEAMLQQLMLEISRLKNELNE
jgi:hypothetical protein